MSRSSVALAVLAVILVLLPFFVGNYALSVATVILKFAYTGQAWNVMMGFAGQLSLGHALYVGVGAYAAGSRSATPGPSQFSGARRSCTTTPCSRLPPVRSRSARGSCIRAPATTG